MDLYRYIKFDISGDLDISGNLNVNGSFNKIQIYYVNIRGVEGFENNTINISGNGTTNYAVFPSVYYGYTGSPGTYDQRGTSTNVDPIVIYSITENSFNYAFTKNEEKSVNIYIQFMVYFDDSADFPKIYDASGNLI